MRALSLAALCCGVALMALNLFGMIVPNDRRASFDRDLLPYESALNLMDEAYAKHGASIDFLKEAVQLYGKSIEYEWTPELATIPIYDNFVLYFAKFLDPVLYDLGLTASQAPFALFESSKYERGFQRGFGICSQNALGLTDILTRRYAIVANMVGLEGHVVLSAYDKQQDKRYLLDPSVGVFLPFDLSHAEKNLSEVAGYYANTSHAEFAERYDAPGNVFFERSGAEAFRPAFAKVEFWAEILKWVIPTLLLLAGLMFRKTSSKA